MKNYSYNEIIQDEDILALYVPVSLVNSAYLQCKYNTEEKYHASKNVLEIILAGIEKMNIDYILMAKNDILCAFEIISDLPLKAYTISEKQRECSSRQDFLESPFNFDKEEIKKYKLSKNWLVNRNDIENKLVDLGNSDDLKKEKNKLDIVCNLLREENTLSIGENFYSVTTGENILHLFENDNIIVKDESYLTHVSTYVR